MADKMMQVTERLKAEKEIGGRVYSVESEGEVTTVTVTIGRGVAGRIGELGSEEVAWLAAVFGELVEGAVEKVDG